MSKPEQNDTFYIGYHPKSPPATARFTRRVVVAVIVCSFGAAVLAALALPYFGNGTFAYGQPENYSGTIRCDAGAPMLSGTGADYLLVGRGKNGAPLEICGGTGAGVTLSGTLISREGRSLLEITELPGTRGPGLAPVPAQPLGRFTLTGEIVDAKCYFGVMNPGEGRLHRACAELCLRGGVPAVFVARDRAGHVIHLIVADGDGRLMNRQLLPWIGESVTLEGDVRRQGKWLVLKPDLTSFRFASR